VARVKHSCPVQVVTSMQTHQPQHQRRWWRKTEMLRLAPTFNFIDLLVSLLDLRAQLLKQLRLHDRVPHPPAPSRFVSVKV
jgi:hypothetical protein